MLLLRYLHNHVFAVMIFVAEVIEHALYAPTMDVEYAWILCHGKNFHKFMLLLPLSYLFNGQFI